MNPVALVTGGSRRVGRAIAIELARAGCDVVVTWRSDREGALQTQKDIQAIGRRCDLRDVDLEDMVDATIAAATLDLTRLDALILNASTYEPTPWGTLNGTICLRDLQVNAVAPVLLTQALHPLLKESKLAGGGSVVAIGDIYASHTPVKGFASYLMSKAALAQAVQQMAIEMAPLVRVNAVLPGVVAWPEEIDSTTQASILKRLPLARAGEPEDVARLVRFLCLEAPFMTGAAVALDGGRSLR